MSSLPVPEEFESPATINGTYSSNNAAPPRVNGIFTNGVIGDGRADASAADGTEDAPGEPDDDMNSLFGDDEDAMANGDATMMAFSATTEPTANGAPDTTNEPPSMPGLDEDDDEFSRAIANGLQEDPIEGDADGDTTMIDAAASSGGPVQPPAITTNVTAAQGASTQQVGTTTNGLADASSDAVQPNGLPHSNSPKVNGILTNSSTTIADQELTSDTTFLDASIDGTIRIWDRRQPNPVARIMPPRGTPPWCMSACWSPDGNFIYTGRRNNSVEEYSLHRGFRDGPRRTFRFPAGSGSVSSLRAMPNGRHLIW
jgi:transcriptional activator SPT8